MADGFVGRAAELSLLTKRLDRVRACGEAAAMALRGARHVGKTRLAQEFCDRAGVPYLFYTATRGASPATAVSDFCAQLRASTLPVDPRLVPIIETGRWADALRVLAAALPPDPSVVVVDDLPWLAEQEPTFEGILQTAWDRRLRSRPLLLLLLGSDPGWMSGLTAYDRPLFGRVDPLTLGPLAAAEMPECPA